MKKFTCTEEILKVTNVETGQLVVMHKDDTLSLPDMMVEDMCSMGWGTCDDFETGERKEGKVILTPENSKCLHGKPAIATEE